MASESLRVTLTARKAGPNDLNELWEVAQGKELIGDHFATSLWRL